MAHDALDAVKLGTAGTGKHTHHSGSHSIAGTAEAGATGSGGIGHVVGVVQTVSATLTVEVLRVVGTEDAEVAQDGLATGVANDVELGGAELVGTHHSLQVAEDVGAFGVGHLHRVAGDGVAQILSEHLALTQREVGDAQLVDGVAHSVLAGAVLGAEVLLVTDLVVVIQGGHHSEAEADIDKGHGDLLRRVLGVGDDARAGVADGDVGVRVEHRHLHHAALRAIPRLVAGLGGDDSVGVVGLFFVQLEGPVLSNAERVLVELLVSATDVLKH